MDAAGAVDAQNAPTAPWKTAHNAASHSVHTHHRFCEGTIEKRPYQLNAALHTKFLTLPRTKPPRTTNGIKNRTKNGTQNPEPNTESEHEQRTEKTEE
jgi:hypothetical protein